MVLLALASSFANKKQSYDAKGYALGGGNLKFWLGLLTYCATLFSTFTLMGMPDFFRTHGVGAWIFLGLTDVFMAVVVVSFGILVHKRFSKTEQYGVGSFLKERFNSKFTYFLYLGCIFIFLIPYAAIQIKGLSSFLTIVIPFDLSSMYWSVFMLVVILSYSSVGGFKAIVYSDAIQAIILLFVTWIVAFNCLEKTGGHYNMFKAVEKIEPALLSVPGPKGLFDFQFLLSSFLAISIMPLTQPQLTSRLIAMKNVSLLRRMAPATAFFAMIVILPSIVLGLYGAIHYSDLPPQEFWANILVRDQPGWLGALSIVGLIAAAMSTTDSQLFTLGNEANIYFKKNRFLHLKTKLLIFAFAVLSLLFSVYTTEKIVPLARLSFAGTALLAPMILVAVTTSPKRTLGLFLPIATSISVIFFLSGYIFKLYAPFVYGLRLDLFLYICLALCGAYEFFKSKRATRA